MYYYYREEPFNQLAKELLPISNNISGLMMTIHKEINDLVKNDIFHKNKAFLQFIHHLNTGNSFHYQGQGYLAALLHMKEINQEHICYYLNNFVFPANTHYLQAIEKFNQAKQELKKEKNPEFIRLITLMNEFATVNNEFIQAVKHVNISCK